MTSRPFAEYTRHAWAGAWVCSAFRNEGVGLSSDMIRHAVACTRHIFGEPSAIGMLTFVDSRKTRQKAHPGRCYLEAGFEYDGFSKGGLIALVLRPENMPAAHKPMPGLFGMLD